MKKIKNLFLTKISAIKASNHLPRFLLVGSFNASFDLIVFFVLANLFNISPIVANLFSTGATMCLSFYLNHSYVFESTRAKRQTILPFFLATILNVWGVQSVVIAVSQHELKTSDLFDGHIWTLNMISKLLGIAVSLGLNFMMYRFVFHKPLDEKIV